MALRQPSSRLWLWTKLLVGGAAVCVGGPALTWYLTPTDEELVKRYNPELRKRSIEGKISRQQEFDSFVDKLKEQSKSDKPIWFVQAEEARREKDERAQGISRLSDEAKARKEEMRRSAGLTPTVKAGEEKMLEKT